MPGIYEAVVFRDGHFDGVTCEVVWGTKELWPSNFDPMTHLVSDTAVKPVQQRYTRTKERDSDGRVIFHVSRQVETIR